MLTPLRKSSSVSSFSIACFSFTQWGERVSFGDFSLKCLLVSVFVLKNSLIRFADRGEGEQDWYVRGDFRFMNFTTFCYLIFNFLLCLEHFFFTRDIYPHPHPRLTTSSHTLIETLIHALWFSCDAEQDWNQFAFRSRSAVRARKMAPSSWRQVRIYCFISLDRCNL